MHLAFFSKGTDTILVFRLRKCRQQKLADAENQTEETVLRRSSVAIESRKSVRMSISPASCAGVSLRCSAETQTSSFFRLSLALI